MENPVLIHSNEILLVAYDKDQHIAESGPLDASQILSIVDEADDAIQIFRINPSEKSCEDISEDIAEIYLRECEEQCFNGNIPHDFILHSTAYGFFLDDIKQREYDDVMYGSYEQQHRLRSCDVL
ncbi:hypothetical protein [Bartonella rattimassiliensis]|uniref:Uncharacterized protein n=1 Tax=Bartonella rattimassiliensis 15908 TaxID=1094556 RepID=J0QW24_9HYPH|nr:hypothetical protein [Bartonella rattimassiliensis]EJF87349.1 hypothetical protein MCY_00473 [Bartonella rattimassiliensis 15908]